MLIYGLPSEALIRSTAEEREREPWDVQTELQAQTVEVLSVMASEKRLRKPITVPRPEHLRRKRRAANTDEGIKQAVGVLFSTRKGVR